VGKELVKRNQTVSRRKLLTTVTAAGIGAAASRWLSGTGAARSVAFAAERPMLTVWMKKQFVDASNTAFMARAQQFGTDRNVNVQANIIAYEEIYPKWIAAIESGNVPDVSFFGYQEVGEFYAKGVLRDVSQVYAALQQKTAFYPSLHEPITYHGKQYAIPFWTEGTVMFVRKDLLGAAGMPLPTTWQQFRTAAKAVTKPEASVYGAGIGYGRGDSDAEWLTRSILWSYGGSLFNKDGAVAVNSPQTVEAFQFIADIFLKDQSTPPTAVNWDDSGNNKAYLSGQAAMVINPGSILWSLQHDFPDLLPKTAIMALPAGPKGAFTAGILNNLGIFTKSKNPTLAQDFIAYVLEPGWYRTWIDASAPLTTPVYTALERDPIWAQPYNQAFPASTREFHFLGYPGPYSPLAGQVFNQRLINDAFQRILVNHWPVPTAVKELEQRMNALARQAHA
jgi:multiple sugar transport system substrate-binding protein